MDLAVERSTFYHIIIITTNTINGKEVTKLLGILQYNFAMKSMNLKDNTHTYKHMSRNDKQGVGNTGEIKYYASVVNTTFYLYTKV